MRALGRQLGYLKKSEETRVQKFAMLFKFHHLFFLEFANAAVIKSIGLSTTRTLLCVELEQIQEQITLAYS